jgi:hypothetical protein
MKNLKAIIFVSVLTSCSKINVDLDKLPARKDPNSIISKLSASDCVDPDLSMVAAGVSLMMCDGSMGVGSLPICSSSGEVDCIASTQFISVDNTEIPTLVVQGQILAGVAGAFTPDYPAPANVLTTDTTNGVAGTYTPDFPLPSNVLASDTTNGAAGSYIPDFPDTANVLTIDTSNGVAGTYTPDFPIPANVLVSDTTNGVTGTYAPDFPDPANVLTIDSSDEVVGTYSPDFPDVGNVHSSDTSNGVAGTLGTCSSDGEVGCLSTAVYKAADTSSIDDFDIRIGTSFAGVSGKMKYNCRNVGRQASYNFDEIVGISLIGDIGNGDSDNIDWWDTIDDFISMGAPLPTDVPTGWADNHCNSSIDWADVSVDGGSGGNANCNEAADDCAFRDRMTDLVWSEVQSTASTWSEAVGICDALNFAGNADWRLPTQKEMLIGWSHGIRGLQGANFGDFDQYFWSATSFSPDTTGAFYIGMGYGTSEFTLKTVNSIDVVCVQGL